MKLSLYDSRQISIFQNTVQDTKPVFCCFIYHSAAENRMILCPALRPVRVFTAFSHSCRKPPLSRLSGPQRKIHNPYCRNDSLK